MRNILLLMLLLFSASALFPQASQRNFNRHDKGNNRRYDAGIYKKNGTKVYHRGSLRVFNTADYQRRQKRIDERIKNMEYSIAELKKQKSDLKRDYLKMLDGKIRDRDADIERLKKERSEVASEKARINAAQKRSSSENLDSRLSEKKREVQVLREMKEKVDTSGND